MSLERINTTDDAAFIAQIGSVLTVDGREFETTDIDIDQLYATGPMKK